MNFYWRQTIVGLLRHITVTVPDLAEKGRAVAEELDKGLTAPWLEEAFSLFQAATVRTRDPIYLTGAYYTSRALDEVRHYEERAGPVRLNSAAPAGTASAAVFEKNAAAASAIAAEADKGMLDLFERIRNGATLEEALSLFPHIGDEQQDPGPTDTDAEGADTEDTNTEGPDAEGTGPEDSDPGGPQGGA